MPQDVYAIDAEFYDAIHDEFEDDIGLWLSFAGQTDMPVLEVGCGSGRITVPLQQVGHRVTGLDPSAAMLERARERASDEGMAIELVEGDLRSAELPPEAYGFVLIPSDVFLHCADAEEQLEWLRKLARSMTFNGRLAIDLPGPVLWLDPASNGELRLVFRGETDDGEAFEAWHLHEDDLAAQTRWLQVTYERTGEDGSIWRRRSEHLLRYVYPAELEHLLTLAGLRLTALYGDYDLGTMTNGSERMIAIAERNSQ